jgi:hypothetical protein
MIWVHFHSLRYTDDYFPTPFLAGYLNVPAPENILDAGRSMVIILPSPPKYPEFDRLSKLVNEYLKKPPFSLKNPLGDYGLAVIVSRLVLTVLCLLASSFVFRCGGSDRG